MKLTRESTRWLLPLLGLTAALAVGCNKVSQSPESAVPAASTVSVEEDDRLITAAVTKALAQSPALQGADITVITRKGDVLLTGFVKDQDQIDQALKVARDAPGAHSVHNELGMKQ